MKTNKTVLMLTMLMMGAQFLGCSNQEKDATPIKVLENYVETSFNAKGLETKKEMESLLTGDTKKRLESWSDEQFLRAFVETKRKYESLKILENKKVSDQETALTYELNFQEGEGDKKAKISQRKLCIIVLEESTWKIKEVRSIRESIEYLKELSLP